ncbi:unnamed protein product, partial [Allacma fusca]
EKSEDHWNFYKSARNKYYNAVREAKKDSWRKFCEDLEDLPATARAFKFIKSDGKREPHGIQLAGGQINCEPAIIVDALLENHFPMDSSFRLPESNHSVMADTNGGSWADETVVQRALSSFKPTKAPGPDNIYPAMLQNGG